MEYFFLKIFINRPVDRSNLGGGECGMTIRVNTFMLKVGL